eukprot:1497911-Prymnesium_polylepis.1
MQPSNGSNTHACSSGARLGAGPASKHGMPPRFWPTATTAAAAADGLGAMSARPCRSSQPVAAVRKPDGRDGSERRARRAQNHLRRRAGQTDCAVPGPGEGREAASAQRCAV